MIPREVVVYPAYSKASLVWPALEALVNVRFRHCSEPRDFASSDAFVSLGEHASAIETALAAGVPCFVFSSTEQARSADTMREVKFSRDVTLNPLIRGRTLAHEPLSVSHLVVGIGGVILAQHENLSLWCRESANGQRCDRLALPFPTLNPGELALDYLHGGRFMELLPLLHFLREIASEGEWRPSALRACFMFDDPNLHWPSYGFLRYREVAKLADALNFHVALATVPLDAYLVHGPTASLFRENPKRLSLLFHGNDHLRGELGVPRSQASARSLVAQSLKRITRFEARSGLNVARVMAPPHGACRPQMFEAMLDIGFQGACISPWSLRDWGGDHPWPPSFGLEMAEWVSGKFPVAPRFRLGDGCKGSIVISAFLNRPIIPVGHHDSVADGLDLLVDLAAFINSLGDVHWCDLNSIFQSSFLARGQGSTVLIKPYSLDFKVIVPYGFNSFQLVCPRGEAGFNPCMFALSRSGDAATDGGPGEPVEYESCYAVQPGECIRFISRSLGVADYRTIETPPLSPWAPLRRIICEVRDRLQPLRRPRLTRSSAPVIAQTQGSN